MTEPWTPAEEAMIRRMLAAETMPDGQFWYHQQLAHALASLNAAREISDQ